MPLTSMQLYEAAAGGLAVTLSVCLLGYLGTKLAAGALRAVTLGSGYWRRLLRGSR
jgi:hypothetical protein